MRARPRRLAFVRFVPPPLIDGKKAARNPFKRGEVYVFIGEIPNMPGHCVIAELNGKIHTGYHTDSFQELPTDEV